jgi:hypothetical protein
MLHCGGIKHDQCPWIGRYVGKCVVSGSFCVSAALEGSGRLAVNPQGATRDGAVPRFLTIRTSKIEYKTHTSSALPLLSSRYVDVPGVGCSVGIVEEVGKFLKLGWQMMLTFCTIVQSLSYGIHPSKQFLPGVDISQQRVYSEGRTTTFRGLQPNLMNAFSNAVSFTCDTCDRSKL